MAGGWGPLAGVCALLLLFAGAWPRPHDLRHSSHTAQTLVDPATARYDSFNPADASLKLVQVVFRHGARTPLNAIYNFRGVNWTHCKDHYQGVEVELQDENGGPQPPPILDPNTPELPGGCRQGTLTEAGYRMALDVGTWLRNRYVAPGGAAGGFLPDLGPEAAAAVVAAAATRPTAAAAAAGGNGSGSGGVASWNPAVATLRTTPIRRTVATLRGVLTGLWPRLAQQEQVSRVAATAAARPVLPVGASVESLEIMYGNNNTCARLGPLYEAMQRDLDVADARDAELPRLNRQVAEALGLDPDKTILWPKLYDHLAAMIADGAPMPAGATREVLDIVWAQAERHEAGIISPSPDLCASLGPGGADGSSARQRRCQEVLRLGIGMLSRRLIDNMETAVAAAAAAAAPAAPAGGRRRSAAATVAAVAPPPPLPSQLYLFSGHDSSIMPLLAVLGQPAAAWPPFASHLVFELWQAKRGRKAATTASAAVGRRGLQAQEQAQQGAGGQGLAADAEFWVRVLYNGAPLVVPTVSNTAGWAPLGLLRQRALLPYAIRPADHTELCSRVDISDLEADVRAPATSKTTATATGASRGGGSRSPAAIARERALKHAML